METCTHNAAEQNPKSRYCSTCGERIFKNKDDKYDSPFLNNQFLSLLTYVSILLLVLFITAKNPAFHLYGNLIWIEFLMAAVTLGFVYFNRKKIIPLLNFREIKIPVLITVMLLSAGASLIINYYVNQINRNLFGADVYYSYLYRNFSNPVPIMIYSMAFFPAVFEELGFRGIVFTNMKDIAGTRAAMLTSAFLFALMHLSFISLVWMIPFAYGLGYLRNKYNTLLYGMAVHFTFNLTVCLLEFHHFNLM